MKEMAHEPFSHVKHRNGFLINGIKRSFFSFSFFFPLLSIFNSSCILLHSLYVNNLLFGFVVYSRPMLILSYQLLGSFWH